MVERRVELENLEGARRNSGILPFCSAKIFSTVIPYFDRYGEVHMKKLSQNL
jgi:hypothetical protein